ncbi:hypothetical protein KL937_005044 [Ogataea polymorpha]|uniref:Repressible acid phosphatase n=1 Tax=Pichia angusta TaxID=870730 RepID=O74677_PICAN|nr:repressible acid phosphatase [Ogataea polymorpha]KAG7877113.1 hypothetical protein KL937_005044 [Ogataea polymorpha]KAG7886119.1 hypothetical protein KL936_005036 [Ogataea polymorpha]KAG7931461.1 hypothetical protein KL904_004969 [Ogataea polymorpha]
MFSFATTLLVGAIVANGLILHPGYDQVATDQYNLLKFMIGAGPFVEHSGFGIPLDTPPHCEIEQAQLFMRHGERFPTKSSGKQYKKFYDKLKKANITDYKGPLAFIEDLEYFVPDSDNYELETTRGLYSGLLNAFKFGTYLRERYDSLVDTSSVLPIFAASEDRVVDTARSFGRGFFGPDYATSCSIQVVNETDTSKGANALTTKDNCPTYNSSFYDYSFGDEIFQREADRLNELSPGFNITADDIITMGTYCAYETNVKGHSSFCDALSREAFIALQYNNDVTKFYQFGPGYNMSAVAGGVYANATAKLLQEDGKLWFSFSHDNDLLNYITALGLITDTELGTEDVDFHRSFKTSELVPQGARLIIEKLNCSDTSFVRTILNDKVYPVPGCSSGPGYSCPLEDYLDIITPEVDYASACELPDDAPKEISFYWDWKPTFENN